MSNNFYSAPSHMSGGYTVYGGYRRQRGGGLFGSFRNFMAPIGRQAFKTVKSIAKNKAVQDVAKKALQKTAEVATGVAVDALHGRDVGESIKERARNATLDAMGANSKRHSHSGRKLKQRKRPASKKPIAKPPAKKRRRRAQSRAALNRRNLF